METLQDNFYASDHGKQLSVSEKGSATSPEDGIPAVEPSTQDVFIDDDTHDIRYKTLSWQFVACLMISEIVSNGMLSLPNAMAVVGIVPALILTVFLGVFALFTSKLLINFKLNHPNVHSMGDAGYIIFGPIGREVLSVGTALSTLSNKRLCSTDFLLIFAIATLAVTLPRTLSHLRYLGFLSAAMIALCGVLAMIGAGLNPVPDRVVAATHTATFYEAFLAVTGPVFAYAGHYMFFIFLSEMQRPQDAMKAAYVLQIFSTAFYAVFSVVIYVYLGSMVQSPALFSLPPAWAKVTFGFGMINFLISGSLCAHTAAKLVFIRLFRHSRHVYTHTWLGWTVWTLLCFTAVAIAFIFAIAVPIFSDLIGITASLFAAWYTYGIAGFFWLHDTYYLKGRWEGLKRRWTGTTLALLTVLAGTFMCVAGTYVSVKLIVVAYNTGLVGKPFSCQ